MRTKRLKVEISTVMMKYLVITFKHSPQYFILTKGSLVRAIGGFKFIQIRMPHQHQIFENTTQVKRLLSKSKQTNKQTKNG